MSFQNFIVALVTNPSQTIASVSIYHIFSTLATSNEMKLANIVLGPVFIVMGTETVVDWVKVIFTPKNSSHAKLKL